MKSSKLRIGNITSMGIVYLIEDDIFRVKNNEGDTFKNTWADIQPIPLTEEWLLKFGFNKRAVLSSVLYDMKNPRFSIYLNPPIDKSNKWNILGIEKNINIQYVHQLQNIYFALTSEELILKSEK